MSKANRVVPSYSNLARGNCTHLQNAHELLGEASDTPAHLHTIRRTETSIVATTFFQRQLHTEQPDIKNRITKYKI